MVCSHRLSLGGNRGVIPPILASEETLSVPAAAKAGFFGPMKERDGGREC